MQSSDGVDRVACPARRLLFARARVVAVPGSGVCPGDETNEQRSKEQAKEAPRTVPSSRSAANSMNTRKPVDPLYGRDARSGEPFAEPHAIYRRDLRLSWRAGRAA